MRARRLRPPVLALAALAVGLAGCSAQDPQPTPTASPTPSGTAPAPQVELPAGAAGRDAAWVLAQLEPGAETEAAEVTERFAESFLAEVPAEQLVTILGQLREAGPWTLAAAEGGPGHVLARIEAAEGELEMQLVHDEEGKVSGLVFSPAPPERDPAESLEGLAAEVSALDAQSSLYLARVEDGACVPVEGFPAGSEARASLPIGSMIKLYVLGAVVEAVEAGELAWEDEVEVTEALRSLPTGRLQDEPAGTRVSVREAAELMISISDNTATDLLIHAVGREQVEAMLERFGHDEPARNVPLMTTRDFFLLGWGEDGDWRERWRGADEGGRRTILESLARLPLEIDLERVVSEPVWSDGIDWFATGEDLCRAHLALAELSRTPAGEPVREILAVNPGLAPPEGYEYLAFKGGSAPGALGGSWFAESGEEAVVVVIQTASPAQAVHAATATSIAQDALRLLAAG